MARAGIPSSLARFMIVPYGRGAVQYGILCMYVQVYYLGHFIGLNIVRTNIRNFICFFTGLVLIY